MNKEQCRVMLETLCCYFGLKVPALNIHDKQGGGRYSYKYLRRKGRTVGTYRRRIFISLRHGDFGVANLLLHEFAHYFAHSRADFRPDRTGNHGPAFRLALSEAAMAWYGCPHKYPWAEEYYVTLRSGPSDISGAA